MCFSFQFELTIFLFELYVDASIKTPADLNSFSVRGDEEEGEVAGFYIPWVKIRGRAVNGHAFGVFLRDF